jgi:3-isopropylmalate/(R)-2-methylmalate dehydratase large subunit
MHKSLYDKLWNSHTILLQQTGATLLYIDIHLIHEITSPQAFNHIKPSTTYNPSTTFGVPDHNIETIDTRTTKTSYGMQVNTLETNCYTQDIEFIEPYDKRQGIVHVIGPELSLSTPGKSIVCGDSHTSTHGALSTLSQGIGTSELTGVFISQALQQRRNRNLNINATGNLSERCGSKDVVLYLARVLGSSGGTGYAVEFNQNLVKCLSVSDRMTLCNMSIEFGAKFGLSSTDNTVLNFYNQRNSTNTNKLFKTFKSNTRLSGSNAITINLTEINPQTTWGTSPEMSIAISHKIPNPNHIKDKTKRRSHETALKYMGLKPNKSIEGLRINFAFIGSCTNSRIEDLREAAQTILREGKKKSTTVRGAIVVPGSGLVKAQAEQEGLHEIFMSAGFEWRDSGCSMCIAMNKDRVSPLERCISTSNRNFEGRQGTFSRTHLASPRVVVLSALSGHITGP